MITTELVFPINDKSIVLKIRSIKKGKLEYAEHIKIFMDEKDESWAIENTEENRKLIHINCLETISAFVKNIPGFMAKLRSEMKKLEKTIE
jgi:hypothetical protein